MNLLFGTFFFSRKLFYLQGIKYKFWHVYKYLVDLSKFTIDSEYLKLDVWKAFVKQSGV